MFRTRRAKRVRSTFKPLATRETWWKFFINRCQCYNCKTPFGFGF